LLPSTRRLARCGLHVGAGAGAAGVEGGSQHGRPAGKAVLSGDLAVGVDLAIAEHVAAGGDVLRHGEVA